jgi:hypothetical protein
MNNPEKLATLGTQDTRRRQSTNTTQYVLDTAMRKQTKWNKYNMALPQTTGGKDKPNNVCMPLFFMCLPS